MRKEIINYEGLYIIDSCGFVISLSKINNVAKGYYIRPERILTNCTDKDGYSVVMLSKNKKASQKKIHRLVAEAFIPNPNNKPAVNHKDGNKKNNDISNLEWVFNKENTIHAYKNKLIVQNYDRIIEMGKRAHSIHSKPIAAFNANTDEYLWSAKSIADACRVYGLNNSCVFHVLNRSKKYNSHKGMYFKRI